MNFGSLANFFTERFVTGVSSSNNSLGIDIPLILQRFITSSVIEDRLKLLENLCVYSNKLELIKDFGTKGVKSLIRVIEKEIDDLIIINPLLQVLLNLTKVNDEKERNKDDKEEENEEIKRKKREEKERDVYGVSYLNSLLENGLIKIILCLLSSKDNYLRINSIELFGRSLKYDYLSVKRSVVKEKGVLQVLKLLNDSNDVVVSKGINLLKSLTYNSDRNVDINLELNKLFGSNQAFEVIFEVIHEEGSQDGGVIVRDCLDIIDNLLVHCQYNRKIFIETTDCVKYLPSLLSVEGLTNDSGVNIIFQSLSIIKYLLDYEPTKISLSKTKMVESIVRLSLKKYEKPSKSLRKIILLSTFNLGNILSKCRANQEVFESFNFSDKLVGNLISAVVSLVEIVCNEFDEQHRQIAENTLFKFLEGNSEGQLLVASTIKAPTLVSSTAEAGMMAGISLTNSIFSLENPEQKHPHSSFHACNILSKIIVENEKVKNVLLELKYDVNIYAKTSTSFFTCIVRLAIRSLKKKLSMIPSVGLMILLCDWIRNSEMAAKQFMKHTSNFLYLVELTNSDENTNHHFQGLSALLIGLLCLNFKETKSTQIGGFTRESLLDVLVRRIGEKKLIEKRDILLKEFKEQPNLITTPMKENPFVLYREKFRNTSIMDFEMILKLIKDPYSKNKNDMETNENGVETIERKSSIPPNSIQIVSVEKLKDMNIQLKIKDNEIEKLKVYKQDIEKQLEGSFHKISGLEEQVKQLTLHNLKMKSDIKLLKEEKKNTTPIQYESVINDMEKKLKEREMYIQKEVKVNEKSINNLQHQLESKKREFENLSSTYNELESLLLDKENEISKLKTTGSEKDDYIKSSKEKILFMEEEFKKIENTKQIEEQKQDIITPKIEEMGIQLQQNYEIMKNMTYQNKQLEQSLIELSTDNKKKANDLLQLKEYVETLLTSNEELQTKNYTLETHIKQLQLSNSSDFV